MRTILSFLLGTAVGFGGAMLYLHKKIKKELEERAAQPVTAAPQEVPFEMNDDTSEQREVKATYNQVINDVTNGITPPVAIPVRRDEPTKYGIEDPKDKEDGEFIETEFVVEEIDKGEFDNNKSYAKERLVYYRGDKIMCTEAAAIISNPYAFVGNQWEQAIGKYTPNTAYIRNKHLLVDYEIYVEGGLYVDDYGPIEEYRED